LPEGEQLIPVPAQTEELPFAVISRQGVSVEKGLSPSPFGFQSNKSCFVGGTAFFSLPSKGIPEINCGLKK
jgi:hypothetical protein